MAPRLGVFSADTWTLIGTYLRNLFVNWLVFIPLLLALFGIPRVYLSLLRTQPPPWLFWVLVGVGILGSICALAYATLNRPSLHAYWPVASFWSAGGKQADFLRWCFLPLVASAFCLTTCWFWLRQFRDGLTVPHINAFTAYPPHWLFYVGGGLLLHLAGVFFAQCLLRRFLVWELAIVLLTGALGGLFISIAARLNYQGGAQLSQFELNACFGLPIFVSLFLITTSIFIAPLSRKTSDEDWEWWTRLGAWIQLVV